MDQGIPAGYYSTQEITASTNVRDVSEVLDLWAHRETPLLNRISWGAESGGLVVEWISESLGWRYVEISAALASGGTTFEPASGVGGLTQAEQNQTVPCWNSLLRKGHCRSR